MANPSVVILAAPDLDLQVVPQRVTPETLPDVPERLTIYISEEDRAIGLASWLFDSVARVGRLTVGMLNTEQRARIGRSSTIDLVDARTARDDFFSHSYFYRDPAVSSDVILILRDNRSPGAENGRPLERLDARFWRLSDSYPNAPRASLPTQR